MGWADVDLKGATLAVTGIYDRFDRLPQVARRWAIRSPALT